MFSDVGGFESCWFELVCVFVGFRIDIDQFTVILIFECVGLLNVGFSVIYDLWFLTLVLVIWVGFGVLSVSRGLGFGLVTLG